VQRLSEKFQTTTESAERLGVSRLTICRWCRQGRFPGALKFGRGWYIPRGDPRGAADFPFETTTEAAERLGVSVPYIIALIERGDLAGERGPWRSYAVARGAMPLSGVKGPSTFPAA
jgi:excisionase family DNA binding protein